MTWKIELSKRAKKALTKIDRAQAKTIIRKLRELETEDDPRENAKALKGKWHGLYRRRIGNYRIIFDVMDDELIVIVVNLGHRKSIYEQSPGTLGL